MVEPKVGIVLINYNGEKFQNDCIRTIKKMIYNNYEIIVVDNNSNDNSIKFLKEEFPEVKIIANNENLGVAKGNNLGIKYAIEHSCEYILLLNNDTEVDTELLTNLVNKASKNVMVTAKIYYFEPKNMLWFAGACINWEKATTTHFGLKEFDKGQFEDEEYIDYSPTCCLLIHKSIFESVGYMDEKYFMYYDDTDFCVRSLKNNFKILYNPKAILWHKVSSSSGGDNSPIYTYYANRNRMYFVDKFYKNKFKVKLFFYITRLIKILIWFLKNEKVQNKMLISAIKDYTNNKMGRKTN